MIKNVRIPIVPDDPASRAYLVIGLAAAVILGLALMERGTGPWLILPPIVAAAGLVFRWVAAPMFVMLGVAITQLLQQPFFVRPSPVSDFVLIASLLGGVLAHYRLCAATDLFPNDRRRSLALPRPQRYGLPAWMEVLLAIMVIPYLVYLFLRPKPPKPAPSPKEVRTGELPESELLWALAAVCLCSIAAIVGWSATFWWPGPSWIIAAQWRLGVLGWSLLLPIVLLNLIVRMRAARRMTVEQARLVLHDTLWKETRREQRYVARRIARARLRQDALSK